VNVPNSTLEKEQNCNGDTAYSLHKKDCVVPLSKESPHFRRP
jgi:hypothetical protein